MTSGDLATARTFSGGRDGTIRDKGDKKVLKWKHNGVFFKAKYPHPGN